MPCAVLAAEVSGLRVTVWSRGWPVTIAVFPKARANYYSWTMTVTGFVNTQYLPGNTVVPNTYIPHIVAGFVQLGILAFYLTIPYFQKQRFVVIFFASLLAITLACLSSFFALFSITMTSQSQPILDHHVGLLKGMNK
jgi:hypothetical protein